VHEKLAEFDDPIGLSFVYVRKPSPSVAVAPEVVLAANPPSRVLALHTDRVKN
jgi:hypothetical protein